MSEIPDFETLEEAKQFLRDNWEKGVDCPCCNRYVRRYKIKLNSAMSLFLINLYKHSLHSNEPAHISELVNKNGKISMSYGWLRYWELAENVKNEDPDKKGSGYWRITELGKKFASGKLRLYSHAYFYDGKSYGHTGNKITIQEALGNKFSYEELMA